MSQSVFQPVGQKRLTNIAVVRMKKHGKRFEIACYKNKVLNWRNGIEKDLDEVLQTTTVYSNVSKAVLASREDLKLVFGTDDEDAVCRFILAHGDLQVSDRERKLELDTKFRDVAAVISEKCINPTTQRPYTIPMIERALKDTHFSVDSNRPAKTQALEALPALQERFPIERARMRLKITLPLANRDELQGLLTPERAAVQDCELSGSSLIMFCLIDPGLFRPVHSLVAGVGGRAEVLALAATTTEEGSLGLNDLTLGDPAPSATVHPAANPDRAPTASADADPAAASPAAERRRAAASAAPQAAPAQETVLYPRGPIAGLPDEYASRRERCAELDDLQAGWTIQLSSKGESGVVDAAFFSPRGARVGAYVAARRQALQASKQAAVALQPA
ncbi:hypothetical protein ACKKBG_A22405 [Auxenochlorella protothecoides x Auxenochlorella symbiontica]